MDEDDALAQVRRFLSYMPSSVDELPPRVTTDDPPDRRDESLLGAVPRSARRTFEPRAIIESVVDHGSFFEIAPNYGGARVTGLARIDGFAVGVMANDPRRLGGATDVAAGSKAARLIQLCDTFHLPLVDFADEPGLMVGIESERQGIERAGARLVGTLVASRMPYLVFVVRRLYGVGGQSHHRASGMYRRYAWPSASWGSMHIAGGTSAAYRREIESADDPDADAPADRGPPAAVGLPAAHGGGDRPGHHRPPRLPAPRRRVRPRRPAHLAPAARRTAVPLPAVSARRA